MVIWGENTTWGFGFNGSDEDDNNDWLEFIGVINYGVLLLEWILKWMVMY